MNKFKVGDRVKVSYATILEIAGQYGTVRNMNVALDLVEVEMLTTGKIFFLRPYLLIKTKSLADSRREGKHQDYAINNPDIRDAIKNVIFNPPATIVFWTDSTKTVVKAEHENYDLEKGLAMAISKKMLGNEGNYYEVFKKWLPKDDPQTEETLSDAVNRIKAASGGIRWSFGSQSGSKPDCSSCGRQSNLECSSCARFDDENMACMISQPCVGYDKHVKKDAHE